MELRQCFIKKSYFPQEGNVTEVQLHGFCDASKGAYAGVIYIRGIDQRGGVQVSLVVAKTKVALTAETRVDNLEHSHGEHIRLDR